jgi:hypothetical protein
LDAATVQFLEGGPGIIVGAVAVDGTPCVARGWGLTVTDSDAERTMVRLLVPSDDTRLHGQLDAGRSVAITAGCVRTYRALQLKGRSRGVSEATATDLRRARDYIDAFFGDLLRISAMPRSQCDRFAPVGYVACAVEIDEVYDQTPGPTAGAALVTLA